MTVEEIESALLDKVSARIRAEKHLGPLPVEDLDAERLPVTFTGVPSIENDRLDDGQRQQIVVVNLAIATLRQDEPGGTGITRSALLALMADLVIELEDTDPTLGDRVRDTLVPTWAVDDSEPESDRMLGFMTVRVEQVF